MTKADAITEKRKTLVVRSGGKEYKRKLDDERTA
jgi:hypothetical protein